MEQLRQDLRIALRGLRRTPGFAITATAILAIGIGMAVAMTVVYDTLLVERLPVVDQARLVIPKPLGRGGIAADPPASDVPKLARESHAFSGVAGVWHYGAVSAGLVYNDQPIALRQVAVTPNFFSVLGTRPLLGRFLVPDDGLEGAPLVMVLSYGAWQRHFGGDQRIIGRRVHHPIFDRDYTIVGVAPPGLDYPAGVEYWDALPPEMGTTLMGIVARLAPSASDVAARDEFVRFMRAVDDSRHISSTLVGAEIRPLFDEMVGGGRLVIRVLTAAVALLLVITCINVGGLLLVRSLGRAREIAIRRAIGASASAIIRQLVVESALLASIGGALGLGIASAVLHVLSLLSLESLPRLDALATHRMPIGVAVVTSGVSLLLFGILPSILAARGSVAITLRLDTRAGAGSRSRTVLRQSLVAAQVAIALTTLSAAGLLVHSLVRLETQDLGYTADNLLIFYLSYPYQRYKSEEAVYRLGDQSISRLRSIPGVVAVTPLLDPPFLGDNIFIKKIATESQSDADADRNPFTPMEVGNADLFRTMGIPIVRGRGFLDSDNKTAPKVVVVSQSLAKRLWPGVDPIGQTLRSPLDSTHERMTVVGVAKDAHYRKLRESSPVIYEEWRQAFWNPYLAVRMRGTTAAVVAAIRRELLTIDPGLSMSDPQTMNELLAAPLAQPRLSTLILGVFAVIALVLSSLGLYGVVSATVRERTRELGVRMALGASPTRLGREVLSRAVAMLGAGAVVGLAAAFMMSTALRALLFEINPADPIALIGACTLLLAVGVGAAFVPARRAALIDPAEALRAD
jgi:putative ABC transport system permease protein